MATIDIKFIAAKAGVSPATVSRVLNRTKKVSPELEKRVLEVVERYQYLPNLNARSLVHRRTKLIGIVAPKVSGAFHAALITEIEKSVNQFGYDVIVSNISGDPAQELKSFQTMRERQVDGVILLHENTPAEMERIRKYFWAPIVLASVRTESDDDYSVTIDDETAARDAVQYLISLCHRRISGVFSESYSGGTLRRRGFQSALAEAGLSPELDLTVDCTIDGGVDAADQVLRAGNTATAVFFMSDETAIGAIRRFKDAGVRIPEDLSIFSFDDIPYSDYVTPRLSTVRQPVAMIGKRAAEVLLKLVQNEKPAVKQVFIPHSVIIRDSCSLPRG